MIRVALAVLMLAMVALADQSRPVEPVCSAVRHGQTMTVAGTRWAEDLGIAIRKLSQVSDEKVTEESWKEYRTALWKGVLKLWADSLFAGVNGTKLDPQIIELRREQEQAEAEAARSCALDAKSLAECTPQGTPPGGEPFDPKTAAIAVGPSATFTAEQRSNAATIIRVAREKGAGRRGAIVGLATAEQESGLRNLAYGDRDSVGVFQQRAGWGSVAERRDVARAAGKFYDHLLRVNGWERMSVTRAAQAVQISAFPNAYAQWEDEANQLIAQLGDLDATLPGSPGLPGPSEEIQCVAPEGSPENPDGSIRMVGVAGMRKVKDPTSGITYAVPMPKDADRRKAMEFAFAQLGEPYVFASQGPDSWDCSSLTAAAWGAAGRRLTPQTESMVREIPHVGKAQPGDLLYHPGHVQMFLGNIGGEEIILEAPRTGLTVRIVKQWMTPTAILDPTKLGASA